VIGRCTDERYTDERCVDETCVDKGCGRSKKAEGGLESVIRARVPRLTESNLFFERTSWSLAFGFAASLLIAMNFARALDALTTLPKPPSEADGSEVLRDSRAPRKSEVVDCRFVSAGLLP
jgi:hypothetical protein